MAYKPKHYSQGLANLEEHREELNKLYSELYTRRTTHDISFAEEYRALRTFLGLSCIDSRAISGKSGDIFEPLEDTYHLERVLKTDFHKGADLTSFSSIQWYARKMSGHVNYLGFRVERDRFFSVFSRVHPDFVYHPNRIKPSPKLNLGSTSQSIVTKVTRTRTPHWFGRRRANNKVY